MEIMQQTDLTSTQPIEENRTGPKLTDFTKKKENVGFHRGCKQRSLTTRDPGYNVSGGGQHAARGFICPLTMLDPRYSVRQR